VVGFLQTKFNKTIKCLSEDDFRPWKIWDYGRNMQWEVHSNMKTLDIFYVLKTVVCGLFKTAGQLKNNSVHFVTTEQVPFQPLYM
jgi:hypothetical protein